MERDYECIGAKYRSYLVFDYKERLQKLKKAVRDNQLFLSTLAGMYAEMFSRFKMPNGEMQTEPMFVSDKDVIKMRSTLKQFVREWSEEGQPERDCCFKPIIEEVRRNFPKPILPSGERIKVLVPGTDHES